MDLLLVAMTNMPVAFLLQSSGSSVRERWKLVSPE